jgi:hypothetical protein
MRDSSKLAFERLVKPHGVTRVAAFRRRQAALSDFVMTANQKTTELTQTTG